MNDIFVVFEGNSLRFTEVYFNSIKDIVSNYCINKSEKLNFLNKVYSEKKEIDPYHWQIFDAFDFKDFNMLKDFAKNL